MIVEESFFYWGKMCKWRLKETLGLFRLLWCQPHTFLGKGAWDHEMSPSTLLD
jgi:hypothetical protein